MKQNGKRKLVSIVLSFLLICTGALMTSAKCYDDVGADCKAKDEIGVLSELGIILGTSENEFTPEENVTREQMASLLFRLMLGRSDAGRVNTTAFTDLYEPYYNGAISWANAAGYIKGVASDRFAPRGGITKQDAMTMLVRALGHETGTMNAGYPWSYINEATKLGLDDGLEDVGYTDTLTRAETAKILYNALLGDYQTEKENTTILENVFDCTAANYTAAACDSCAMNGEKTVTAGTVRLDAADGGNSITVSDDVLGVKCDDAIGCEYQVISSEKGDKVLAACANTERERAESVQVNEDGSVTVDGVKYGIGEENTPYGCSKLNLYCYTDNGELTKCTDCDVLDSLLGFYQMDVVDNASGRCAFLKPYSLGKLSVSDGKINLAENKSADEISVTMNGVAKDGDVVLYRYDKEHGKLEIADIVASVSGVISRMTENKVTVGGETYALGNEKGGVSAESVKKLLTLGEEATVYVSGGCVVAVSEKAPEKAESAYLVALSEPHLIYENGAFSEVMTVFVNGEQQNVKVSNREAKVGEVYRYTEQDGTLTLVSAVKDSGLNPAFIEQSGEIAAVATVKNETVLTPTASGVYALSDNLVTSVDGREQVKFVFDDASTLVIRENGVTREVDGKYASTLTVNAGAKITAVLRDEVGDIETVKYLYISSGVRGNYDADGEVVRILSRNGMVYENGVYTEYTVYSFRDNAVKTMLSKEVALTVGKDYRAGKDNTVTADEVAKTERARVTGYTANTVTLGEETYTVNDQTKVVVLGCDGSVGEAKIASLYGREVEYIRDGERLVLILTNENCN